MKKYILGILIGVFLGLLPTAVFAQSQENWRIGSFDTAILLESNGRAIITETIKAQFGSEKKHGIIRVIPTIYRTQYESNLNIRLKVLSVENEKGAPVKFEESRKDGEVSLRIGHPDVYVSGTQTYLITYVVDNALTRPSDSTEFYWNVTGNKWTVPIDSVTTTLSAPKRSVVNSICFSGLFSSKTQNCSATYTDESAVFGASKLALGEGLTIAVSFDPTLVSLPSDRQRLWWTFTDNWIVALPILTFLLLLRLYWTEGRDKRYREMFNDSHEIPVPLFERLNAIMVFSPPKNLSPGEVGVLVDEKVQMRDITAIAIDLASRGFFSIREIAKKKLFLDDLDFELTRTEKSEVPLKAYELRVLDMLFGTERKQTVLLSKLPEKSYLALNEVITALYSHATESGFFLASPAKVRNFYTTLGIILIFAAFFQGLFLSAWFNPFLSGACVIISAFIVLLFAPNMPARTGKGRKLLQEVVGLKEWIRIGAWREQIHEKRNFLEEVLPYTIVFGLTQKFIKAFSKADLNGLEWYKAADPAHFNLISSFNAFEDHLDGGVAQTRPQTSSGNYGGFGKTGASSGGSGFSSGSSGGGFGGGGGSSW